MKKIQISKYSQSETLQTKKCSQRPHEHEHKTNNRESPFAEIITEQEGNGPLDLRRQGL